MNVLTHLGYRQTIAEICDLPWTSLGQDDMVCVAWAYYYFSVQFRESLVEARRLYPQDEKLQHLEHEECNTPNLSPWPGVAAAGEPMNHDEFMRRTLLLSPIDPARASFFHTVGTSYLEQTRTYDDVTRAAAIASYEDGGLEALFTAILRFDKWEGPLLQAFQHFLSEHVRFDSDPEQGHGALSRHMAPDDRVIGLWEAFRQLLVTCVPVLSMPAGASTIRSTILAEIANVAEAQQKRLPPLTDDLALLDSGLDSLCIAVLVAALDDKLGLDPFGDEDLVTFPVTVGEFIALYEHAAA